MLQVGGTIWHFDQNRRRYTKPAKGREFGECIWREHWVKCHVVGETRASWLVARFTPRPGQTFDPKDRTLTKLAKADFKAGGCPNGWAFDEAHVDRLEWVHENGYRLSQFVMHCHDYEALVEIARLVGFKPTEPRTLVPEDR